MADFLSNAASLFQRILLPPIILQSVLIGGGYSTGREVVEYAAKYGESGWVSVVVIFAGFSLMSVLAFEVARLHRTYDYKRWIRTLIGPLWPLFDLLVIVMLLLIIAVMMSAVTSIVDQTLGIGGAWGIGVVVAVVAVLNFFGARAIERFKTAGTLILYCGYLSFATVVLTAASPDATMQAVPEVCRSLPAASAFGAGVLYVGYNLAVFPTVLFSLHRQRSRLDAVVSGLVAGMMMTVPFFLTFICILSFPRRTEAIAAEVPWLLMLSGLGSRWVVPLFGVVVGWTLVETSVGSIHAVIDRVDSNVQDLPSRLESLRMTGRHRAMISVAVLSTALALSRLGIIDLVAKGYRLLAFGFIGLLALPLLAVGVVRIVRPPTQ